MRHVTRLSTDANVVSFPRSTVEDAPRTPAVLLSDKYDRGRSWSVTRFPSHQHRSGQRGFRAQIRRSSAVYTVKISVYPRAFCGEFSIFILTEPVPLKCTKNSPQNIRGFTDISTVYSRYLLPTACCYRVVVKYAFMFLTKWYKSFLLRPC